MFFNRDLQEQLAQLQSALFLEHQVKKSLDDEMLVLEIDNSGKIQGK